jgi:hypothetical protein
LKKRTTRKTGVHGRKETKYKGVEWIHPAEDTDEWWALVKAAVNL